ncbi:MAG TPA: WhiB family transcriptional regulator [Actinocrinis sp.]|nr:WhiB family transcriptional regulator [Actinocrinis sp.]
MADFSRLPGPNADLWDWQLRGLCRGKDSSLFFHPEGERGAARSGREVAAKEICLNCPVQIPCVEHALRVREPYGVWGGMTEDEREEYYAKQKILARAQAARAKAAKVAQARLKEQLLREKAAQLTGVGGAVGAGAGGSYASAGASAHAPAPAQGSTHRVGAARSEFGEQPEPVGAGSVRQAGQLSAGQIPTGQTRPEPPQQPAGPPAQNPQQPQSARPQPVRAAARGPESLADTVAAVKRSRKANPEPAKKAAPSKTAPKNTAAKSAPKKSAPAAPKTATKRLTKV